MSTLNVSFKLSEKARKREFATTGTRPKETQTATFDLEDATEHQRKRLLMYVPLDKFDSNQGITLENYTADKAYYDNIHKEAQILDFPPADLDALLDILADMATQKDHIGPQLAQWDAESKAYSEQEAQKRTTREQRVAEARAKADQAKADRIAAAEKWIAEFGSKHLKDATSRGYNCDRLYQLERAAQEYPGFELDYDNNAEWTSRSCPSETALSQVTEIEQAHPDTTVTVVWLTKPVFNSEIDEEKNYELALYDFTEREAITVDDQNFTRDLVK